MEWRAFALRLRFGPSERRAANHEIAPESGQSPRPGLAADRPASGHCPLSERGRQVTYDHIQARSRQSGYLRPASVPTERPTDTRLAHDTADGLSYIIVEH